MAERSSLEAKTIVLVHGGFGDGSGWEGVYNILRKDGYTVAIVRNPTLTLALTQHLRCAGRFDRELSTNS